MIGPTSSIRSSLLRSWTRGCARTIWCCLECCRVRFPLLERGDDGLKQSSRGDAHVLGRSDLVVKIVQATNRPRAGFLVPLVWAALTNPRPSQSSEIHKIFPLLNTILATVGQGPSDSLQKAAIEAVAHFIEWIDDEWIDGALIDLILPVRFPFSRHARS